MKGAVCSSGGNLVKGALRSGPFIKGGTMHSWRWEVIRERGLNARKDSRRSLEA